MPGTSLDKPGHDEFADTPNHYMTAYAIACRGAMDCLE